MHGDMIHARDYFNRFAPIYVVITAGPIAMAIFFAAIVMYGGSPITEGVYGSQVYEIPALVWSVAQIAVCLPATVGFVFRIRWLAFLGSSAMGCFLAMFAVLSMGAPEATLLQAICLLWGGPIAWLGAAICYTGVRGGGR